MRMKTTCMVAALTIMCALSGCGGQPDVEAAREEKTYPEPDEVASSLTDAGFEVEKEESFEDLEINVNRVKATSGEDYLDVCYDVTSEDDVDKIVEYYTQNYQKYNLVIEDEIVYCYSSESVVQSAGLQ